MRGILCQSCKLLLLRASVREDWGGRRIDKVLGLCCVGKAKTGFVWVWLCDCGCMFTRTAAKFKSTGRAACRHCAEIRRAEKAAESVRTHGRSRTKDYRAWWSMKYRCLNKKCKDYGDYGGRGIQVYEPWIHSFANFLSYIGPCPDDGIKYSVDRENVNGNYEPGNVRWATDEQQARNKRMQNNNSSGITGVIYVLKYNRKGEPKGQWEAFWLGSDGKQKRTSFSVDKYGDGVAKQMAADKRKAEIDCLNACGAGYSSQHGL